MGLDAAEPVGGLGRHQMVVDADAVIALPGAGLIIPEGVGPGGLVPQHMGVGQAQVLHRPEGRAGVSL